MKSHFQFSKQQRNGIFLLIVLIVAILSINYVLDFSDDDIQVNDEDRARDWTRTEGMIWLTGMPFNAPNDRTVEIRDLELYGDTDRLTGDLLVRFAMGPVLRQRIAAALTEGGEEM